MKKAMIVLMFCFVLSGTAAAQTWEFGVKAGSGGISEIGFVYSEYYRVEPQVVVNLERRRLPEDDVSVLLFLAQRSNTAPEVILRWRLAGDSWWVITHRLRLDPVAVYYVPIPDHVRPGPPYGKAYGYYRKHPPARQKSGIREALREREAPAFDDDDIRNLVQLKLVSGYYSHRAEDIMKRRERGEVFGKMIRVEHEKKYRKKSGIREAIREREHQEQRYREPERRDEPDRKKKKKKRSYDNDDDDDHPGKGKKKKKKYDD